MITFYFYHFFFSFLKALSTDHQINTRLYQLPNWPRDLLYLPLRLCPRLQLQSPVTSLYSIDFVVEMYFCFCDKQAKYFDGQLLSLQLSDNQSPDHQLPHQSVTKKAKEIKRKQLFSSLCSLLSPAPPESLLSKDYSFKASLPTFYLYLCLFDYQLNATKKGHFFQLLFI